MNDTRTFNAPLSHQRADNLIQSLDLSVSSHVLDIGCGHGQLLQRIALQYQIHGVGVDSNADVIRQANDEWATQTSKSEIQFVDTDAVDYVQTMSPVDAIICIGAEYILGGYTDLLRLAKQKLNPVGKLLAGLVYWKQPPAIDYLKSTGMENDTPYFDLFTTVNLAREQGYIPLEVHRSNDDEWDEFENSTARQRYETAMQSGDTELHQKTWQWQSGYLKWGMDTMGFCYLILQVTE